MPTIYDSRDEPLKELLRKASERATLLIPDLQRPFVWSPQQVIDLVDSIFRGWPFGTLLLWDIGEVRIGDHMIPNRALWRLVDRTDSGRDACFDAAILPNRNFTMVLDGQQRLQSLLLAFSTDDAGFVLYDKEWKIALEGSSPYRGAHARVHWTKGRLYRKRLPTTP
jgi:hypothetical protein